MIGTEAGYFETGSNKLYIDNTSSNNPLIYGEFNNDLVKINGDLYVDDVKVNLPVGTVQMWLTDTAPDGWLICDGSTFTIIEYPKLAGVLGTTTLPDLRKRFPFGTDGSTEYPLKGTGGEEEVTLTTKKSPPIAITFP
jgi:hypothetical protein